MRRSKIGLFALALSLLAACSGKSCGGDTRKATGSGAASASGKALVGSIAAGLTDATPELRQRLDAALRAQGPAYRARTRHLLADGAPKYTNRLILESSPYLLQHAHNPVNWYAWGDEAFERARALRRPIFLSVGYSTCHWCHVMEEESFEDEEIAAYLNRHYVCIKVDREERPDIDATYMTFVQSLTGRGGWPMSVWLTPSREPFFGGTYFPPRAGARGAGRGLLELAGTLAERFAREPAAVVTEAQAFARRLLTASEPQPAGDLPTSSAIEAASAEAARRFDPVLGGARGAPKFPSSFPVRLLLRVARRTNGAEARRMAIATLDHMRRGGIYDQVGGGFHRYSTDARWLVPHFEKMLYDNALLAVQYLEAGQATGDPSHHATARDVLDYLLREMTAPDGTFYSATDADSLSPSGRREEGLFFTWTPSELTAVLGASDARIARAWFGVSEAGDLDGRSVLRLDRPAREVARELGLAVPALEQKLRGIRAALLAARATRSPPLRDEKVIVAWSALAVSAFARAAIVLGESRYAEAAVRAARVLSGSGREGQEPPHLLFGGKPRGRAFADDQVFLAAALLDVFELTSEPAWLERAATVMDAVEREFADPAHGGYFLTSAAHERLIVREKTDVDGPTPSASSVAALTWLRLDAFRDDARYRERAETTLRAFARTLSTRPLALDQMLLALDWASDRAKELVIVVPQGRGATAPAARPLLDVLVRRFVPNLVILVAAESDIDGELGRRVPWLRDKRARGGRATAYVCERGACQLPTTEPGVLATQLTETQRLGAQ